MPVAISLPSGHRLSPIWLDGQRKPFTPMAPTANRFTTVRGSSPSQRSRRVTNFFQYNAKGELAYTAIAMDPSEAGITFSGSDRITWTTNYVTFDHGMYVRRSDTYVWLTAGSDSPTLVSSSESSTNGLDTWQTQFRDATTPVTTTNQTVPGVLRTVTTTAPDGFIPSTPTLMAGWFPARTMIRRARRLGRRLTVMTRMADKTA